MDDGRVTGVSNWSCDPLRKVALTIRGLDTYPPVPQ